LLSTICRAQDISGSWKGNTSQSFWILNSKAVVVEISVYNDSLITGVTHAYYTKGRYEHYKIHGKYNRKDSTIIFTEDSVISYNIGSFGQCFGKYVMKLGREPGKWVLNGTWSDKKAGLFRCPTLDIHLEKEIKDTIVKKQPVNDRATIAAGNGDKRFNDIQTLIEVNNDEKDSIRIDVYDNGEIDNDTVSIFLDDGPLVINQMLKATPVSFTISLDRSRPIQKIRMIAENLGSIPPNTALMIVKTKRKRYEIHLSSDFSKNASVEFFLKE
jgi:hypothetical protein